MSTILDMGRKPTVGGTAEHSQFARDLTTYLTHVREKSGFSIRKVSELPPAQRSNSWWADIFNGSKIFTTNDIHYVAVELLGISPYRLVENARKHAEGEETPRVRFGVSGMGDDVETLTREEEQGLRRSELELAAYRGRNEADRPHAE